VAGDLVSFRRYMGNKVAIWRQDAVASGFAGISGYLMQRGPASLAEELRHDNQFWSERICEFVSSTRDDDLINVISTVNGFWDADLGIAASIVVGGIELACSSRGTQNLAAPVAILAGLALLLIVLSLLGE
jgi:hypothetical protein